MSFCNFAKCSALVLGAIALTIRLLTGLKFWQLDEVATTVECSNADVINLSCDPPFADMSVEDSLIYDSKWMQYCLGQSEPIAIDYRQCDLLTLQKCLQKSLHRRFIIRKNGI